MSSIVILIWNIISKEDKYRFGIRQRFGYVGVCSFVALKALILNDGYQRCYTEDILQYNDESQT